MFTWVSSRLAGLRAGKPENIMAGKLYASIVAQARQPVFYRELTIADTIPGRLEMVSLHMFIVLDRLADGGELTEEVAQQLVDVMFEDMDDVAREIGVGDMGVGPRIKKLARSFQSRLDYYKQTIEGDADDNFPRGTLPEALIEIHFKNDASHQSKAEILAKYVIKAQAKLTELSLEEMIESEQLFGEFELGTKKDSGS